MSGSAAGSPMSEGEDDDEHPMSEEEEEEEESSSLNDDEEESMVEVGGLSESDDEGHAAVALAMDRLFGGENAAEISSFGRENANAFAVLERSLLFSRRDRRVALMGHASLWHRLHRFSLLEGHGGCVNTLNFSADGALVVSGSDDQSVRVWRSDVEDGAEVATLFPGHTENVFCAQFRGAGSAEVLSCDRGGLVAVSSCHNSRVSVPGSSLARISPVFRRSRWRGTRAT